MWAKIIKIAFYITLWVAIVAYCVYATILTIAHNQNQEVSSIKVAILDSTARGQMLTPDRIRNLITDKGLASVGTPCQQLNIKALKDSITKNGYVASANLYTCYDGQLHIDIHSLCPLFRLFVDGHNSYVSYNGRIFFVPPASVAYVPVVTGDYKPLFDPTFSGNIADNRDSLIALSNAEIGRIKKQIDHIQYAALDSIKALRSLTRKSHASRQYFGESKEEYAARREKFDVDKQNKIKNYNHQEQLLHKAIYEKEEKIEEQKKNQKNIYQAYNDFWKLINFVSTLSQNKFWSGEITQIVATSSSANRLNINLIPRSGDFIILFGELVDIDSKIERLTTFYQRDLPVAGWNRYKTINVMYDNKIVCK